MTFGAALWSALVELRGTWDDEETQHDTVEPIVSAAFEMLEEVRDESDGFCHALADATDAVWTFVVYRERGATAPADAIDRKLLDALAWLTTAVACTDTVALSGLGESLP